MKYKSSVYQKLKSGHLGHKEKIDFELKLALNLNQSKPYHHQTQMKQKEEKEEKLVLKTVLRVFSESFLQKNKTETKEMNLHGLRHNVSLQSYSFLFFLLVFCLLINYYVIFKKY